jgi:phosphoglycerate dehydrogenase-like enzyme
MPKVLIAPMTLAEVGGPYLDLLCQAGFAPVYPHLPVQLLEDELLQALKGVSASVAGSEPYTRRVIEANPSLQVIARVGVGFDAVDLQAAVDHGIVVCTAPGTNHDAVAEHTFALILALAKELVPQHLATRAGGWPRQVNLPLRGKTLGLAGLGRIGKAVAYRGRCFTMRVLAYDPVPDQQFARDHGIALVPFEQLVKEADYLSLHLPYTAESRHLFNRQTLAHMKPTAFLINTARGGLVREADLIEALRDRRIAGAGLDVFEQEPPAKSPLFEFDNVIVTPHVAGGDLQSRDDMALAAARAIVALSRGEWPAEQIVNPEVRAKFSWRSLA